MTKKNNKSEKRLKDIPGRTVKAPVNISNCHFEVAPKAVMDPKLAAIVEPLVKSLYNVTELLRKVDECTVTAIKIV